VRISLGGAIVVIFLLACVVAGSVGGAPHVVGGWWHDLAREMGWR
jgi:hypothetical protein